MSLPEYPSSRRIPRPRRALPTSTPTPATQNIVHRVSASCPFVVSLLSECKISQTQKPRSYASVCGPAATVISSPVSMPHYSSIQNSSPPSPLHTASSPLHVASLQASPVESDLLAPLPSAALPSVASPSCSTTSESISSSSPPSSTSLPSSVRSPLPGTSEQFTWFRSKRIFLPHNLSDRVGVFIPSTWRNAAPGLQPDAPTEKIKNHWWELQRKGREGLVLTDDFDWSISETKTSKRPLKLVGGVDISFAKNSEVDACASVVVCEFPSLRVVYEAYSMCKLTAPYVPGLLAFREVEHIALIINKMRETVPHFVPDVLLVDGQGLLHMRNYGLACHLGATVNIPTIGIGKTLLVCEGITHETVESAMSQAKQDSFGDKWGLLQGKKGTQAYAVEGRRTSKIRLYVSQGHRISLATAREVVFACLTQTDCYLPEPVHQADALSRDFLRDNYSTLR